MPTFLYPTNREISTIGPAKVARLEAERVGFQIMPMRNVNAGTVEWVQADNYFGLQQLRGLDGAPSHVKRVGVKTYVYEPGVYGEFQHITETELTRRAGSVQGEVPIDVGDLVLMAQDHLISREMDRIEQIIWTLLATGTFSVLLPSGATGFTATFALATFTASPGWATIATATPLKDFRSMRIANAGVGANFGAGATAYMNSTTAANMLNNTNAADLGGRRVEGGNTVQNVGQFNRIVAGNDTPQIVEYDEGYYNDSNAFTRFIPDNKVVVIGRRPAGQRIGEYLKTRNANNPGMAPGSYDYIDDKTGNGPNGNRQVPANLTVHRGHNGGPTVYFPGSIVIMSV